MAKPLICNRVKLEEAIKQKKFDSPLHKATINLMYTANWLHGEFRDLFKSFDITHQQYNVLRILRGRYPECVNPTEIKEVMLDKNPDITRLCDRLLLMGLIDRAIDKTNRRKMKIIITEKGMNLLLEIEPVMKSRMNELFSSVKVDYEAFNEMLDALRG
jgi:DNA-binding MarR family transcriptional regulator